VTGGGGTPGMELESGNWVIAMSGIMSGALNRIKFWPPTNLYLRIASE
jgi:hypothetical protein